MLYSKWCISITKASVLSAITVTGFFVAVISKAYFAITVSASSAHCYLILSFGYLHSQEFYELAFTIII